MEIPVFPMGFRMILLLRMQLRFLGKFILNRPDVKRWYMIHFIRKVLPKLLV